MTWKGIHLTAEETGFAHASTLFGKQEMVAASLGCETYDVTFRIFVKWI